LRGAGTNAIPIVLPLELDGRTLTFAGVAVAIAALVVGLPSASGAMRLDWAATSRVFRSPLRWRSRGALLTAESALCVVLLAGAGLLVRTVVELRSVPTGLDANRVLTITLAPYLAGYSASESAIFRDRAVEDVRLLPGVESASTSMVGPMRGSGLKTSIAPTGQRVTATDELASSINEAGPGYFRTMGMDLVAGRDFLPSDEPGQAPAPAVINQALARRYFSDQNPLGRTFGLGQPDIAQANYRVIGIVSDAKYRSMREPVPPTFFTPERSALTFELVARSTSPRSLSEPIGRAIEAIDPNVPVLEVHALDEEVEASIAAERLLASVTSAFGVAAVAMTAIGVYGLFAQFVSERRRELGIRLAVGANSRDVRLMVVRQAFGMIAPGLAIGLGATLLSGRLIESLIYGVRSQDPASIVVALLVVGLSGIAGAWIPARQAGKTDPASVLRAEG
jgi:predicted permease